MAVSERLPSYAVFAAMLSAAGLPIYIHAPKFYVDEFGVSLAALGTVLFLLRLLDVFQDPALGWLSRRLRHHRAAAVAVGSGLMAVSMVGLFGVTPPIRPIFWFALTLAGLFSGFSFLTITFYAQGVSKADAMGEGGHVRLAAWRETGALLGVSLAAVAPVALLALTDAPFRTFAWAFACVAVLAVIGMRREWRATDRASTPGIRPILSDPLARRLLLIALVNATPVAVTSTLFLFFVESRLEAPGWEGPLLLLFFLAAAAAAPVWGRVAAAVGPKPALIAGMILAILSFGCAALLGPGDAVLFALICLASGASLGADLTLLPAMFAARLERIAPEAAEGFGLWSFVSKFTLAFAAVTLLPLLELQGFQTGDTTASPPGEALFTLTLMYAVLPCILKLFALALLATTPIDGAQAARTLKEV
ncbi:sugar:cation symporter [Alphaproteobacteria bacterium GH1-50]|uniref:Sugar:cation symporter n=1 Tax=Kangsaoukella pontilimi TaxID=2691042 RepID=A0A7C9MW54_9RHOB|nr:MFS transporter [Kangsaoukella pontilimi]MXQ08140.1 sugar:cation symporter [Kangsaoukella pontilimi]